jgi:hypothetical protein
LNKLQKFHAVGVDLPVHLLNGMVNHGVLELVQILVGFQSVGEDRGARHHMLADFSLHCFLLAIPYDLRPHLSTALQDAHHDSLVFSTRASDNALTLHLAHIASLATDESFVNFNFTTEHFSGTHTKRKTNPVIHEPRRFLRHADSAVNFIRAYAVLAIHNLPHCRKPLVKTNWGIFKDGTRLESELPTIMMTRALPAVVLRLKHNALATAVGADHNISPTTRYQVFAAIVRLAK